MNSVRRNIGEGPSCGKPDRLTLITQTGADNRGYILKKSLPLCAKVFDKIIVVDSGSTDDTLDICHSVGATVINFDLSREHHPEMFAHAAALVPMGEWIFYMDSDECPSPALLCSFNELVLRGNDVGIDRYMLPHATHWWNKDGELVGANLSHLIRLDPSQFLVDRVAHRPRLIKKNKGLILEYKGSHWVAVNDGKGMFMPLHWNHYKGDKSCCQSSFIHGLSYPDEHNLQDEMVSSPELIHAWKDEQKKRGYTMRDIALWSASREAPGYVMDIISQWEGLDQVPHEIWRHAFEFGFDGEEPVEACQCPLCDYSQVDQLI